MIRITCENSVDSLNSIVLKRDEIKFYSNDAVIDQSNFIHKSWL